MSMHNFIVSRGDGLETCHKYDLFTMLLSWFVQTYVVPHIYITFSQSLKIADGWLGGNTIPVIMKQLMSYDIL